MKINFSLAPSLFLFMAIAALPSCASKKVLLHSYQDGYAAGAADLSVECKKQISALGNKCREKVLSISQERDQLLSECMASEKLLSEKKLKLDCTEVK